MHSNLITEIQQSFESWRDPQQAKHMKAYMLNQFEFLGIRATPRRQLLKAVVKTWPKETFTRTAVLKLTKALWQLPEREYQYAAIDLLNTFQRVLTVKDMVAVLKLVQQQSWWDTVDGLSGVIGDVLLRHKTVNPNVQQLMDDCLVHPQMWVRRVAMIHQLGWKTNTDQARLLSYALTLAHEQDFFIRKAIGWALRDHARSNPVDVRRFLKQHSSVLSPLTVREAGKHL